MEREGGRGIVSQSGRRLSVFIEGVSDVSVSAEASARSALTSEYSVTTRTDNVHKRAHWAPGLS